MSMGRSGWRLALVALAAGTPARADTPTVVLKQPIQHAATIDLSLRAADAATIARSLGEALGGTVQIEGTLPTLVTLDLQGAGARAALDGVVTALNGSWRPIYTVTAAAAAPGARRPTPVGRTVTANLDQVSPRAALMLVARAGGGTLVLAPELSKMVSLSVKEMPVEEALDEVTRQVGATWSVAYVIKAGSASLPPPVAAAPPAVTPPSSRVSRTQPASRGLPPGFSSQAVPRDVLNDPRSFPMPFAPRSQGAPAAPATDPNAAKMLAEGLSRVMQMPPAQRRLAVKDFAGQIDQQFRQMQALPAPRRNEQMASMRPLYQAAQRTYSGLTPDQRREFEPLITVFNRWMR
jgi:hypothetical protein